jgi:hypothetical protein
MTPAQVAVVLNENVVMHSGSDQADRRPRARKDCIYESV